jgi:hypothetical protein
MKNITKISLIAFSQLIISAGVWLEILDKYIIGTIVLMSRTMLNQILSQIEGVL